MAFAAPAVVSEVPLQKVRVQLKWFHQFQFAGFYAAIEKGFFRKAGLDVELLEGGPDIDPAQVVAEGRAEFGVGNSSLLIDFNAGRPVVAIAAIFQHSPFVLLTRRDPAIRSVRDLEGRILMGELHSAELTAYLKMAQLNLDRVRLVPHSGTVQSLAISGPGRVDATTAYITTEPFEAARLDIPYQIFNPRDVKIDFYGDTLFTSKEIASGQAFMVSAMKHALIEGWKYARQHQAEVIDLIQSKYPGKLDRKLLSLEAQALYNLISADVVDIGYMSRARWEGIGKVFAQTGLLPKDYRLEGFLFQEEEKLPVWVYQAMLWGGLVVVLGGAMLAYIALLNRRLLRTVSQLAEQTHALERANAELSQLSATDPLTQLFNRRYYESALRDELARVARNGMPLTLMMLDVDEFKRYNDTFGHPAGDRCLQEVAAVLRNNSQRAGDVAARIGGEEFAILASNLDGVHAQLLAERIRTEIERCHIAHPLSGQGQVTVSIGICTYEHPDPTHTAENLVAMADAALYAAKQRGRNCCVSAA